MSVAIGIDLGTTNTVVAAVVDGVAVTLEDDQGRRLLPSVVSFHPSSTVLVGEAARERRLIDPENTIFSIKPLLGRPWDSEEVQNARPRFPFQLVEGAKNSAMVLARDVAYALPEISAFVLRRAKSIAEAALGRAVDRAVITVPANFNDLQRASTKIAGKLAGFDVMRILNEPTAAALAYGQSISKAEKIGVYDLGGGTFDITLLDLTGNVFEVLATAGDTHLGGDDIDRALADRIALEVIKRYNVDPRTNPASSARLTFIAEELKKELSSAHQAQREISGIGYSEAGQPITMPVVMTRADLESIARPFVERTVAVARQSMEIVGLSPREFDRVILVGGSTRIPLVSSMVEGLFGQPPHLKVNPDEVVALGAAIQAHALNRTKGAHTKRRSVHDQLAKAQPKPAGSADQVPTRPPDADPALGSAPKVPKAPPLPDLGTPVSENTAPMPEFLTFNKAPAVISFSSAPPRPEAKGSAAKPPELPRKPPPLPGMRSQQKTLLGGLEAGSPTASPPQKTPTEPRRPQQTLGFESSAGPPSHPVQGQGRSSHAANALRGRTIEGRAISLDQGPSGPKPARSISPKKTTSPGSDAHARADLGPSDIVAAPDLDFGGRSTLEPRASAPQVESSGSRKLDELDDVDHDFFQSLELGSSRGASFDASSSSALLTLPELPDPSPERFLQGSAIATATATPLLIDVTPLSLGVETAGGYADVLIPANSPVPCEKTRTFLTASDHQTTVSIRVAQGESPRFAENTRLGDLVLSGLRSAFRGEVKIAVTFELDADGILNVRAKDQDTGRETQATMRLAGANNEAEDLGAMAARQARHIVA